MYLTRKFEQYHTKLVNCKIVSFGRHGDKNYVYYIKENNQIRPLEHEESYIMI